MRETTMTIKQAEKQFGKMLTLAKRDGEPDKSCSCCGGKLPPKSAYEVAREWSVPIGDCDGSVQSNGNCRAFGKIGW